MSAEEIQLEKKVVRANLATRSFVLFVILSFMVGMVMLLVISAQSHQRSVEIERQTGLIRSCTTPGETCFQEAQHRTGRAVASINQVIILAAACAVGKSGTPAQIELQIQTCVIKRLAHDNAKGNP